MIQFNLFWTWTQFPQTRKIKSFHKPLSVSFESTLFHIAFFFFFSLNWKTAFGLDFFKIMLQGQYLNIPPSFNFTFFLLTIFLVILGFYVKYGKSIKYLFPISLDKYLLKVRNDKEVSAGVTAFFNLLHFILSLNYLDTICGKRI